MFYEAKIKNYTATKYCHSWVSSHHVFYMVDKITTDKNGFMGGEPIWALKSSLYLCFFSSTFLDKFWLLLSGACPLFQARKRLFQIKLITTFIELFSCILQLNWI